MKLLRNFCKYLNNAKTKIFIRLTHFILTACVVATFLVRPTDLKEAVDQLDFIILIPYFIILAFSLVMYYCTCYKGPGYVPLDNMPMWKSVGEDQVNPMINSSEESPITGKCGFCGIQQPLRARHCPDCKRCVRKFDHHCPWLETCIGEDNHRYFILFLLSECVIIGWSFHIAWSAIEYHENWKDWFEVNMFFLFDLPVLSLAGLAAGLLLAFHTFLILTNRTTWEAVSRERIAYLKGLDISTNPFDEGLIKNVYKFFFQCKERQWEIIYNRNTGLERVL